MGFRANEGTIDRILRVIAGGAMIFASLSMYTGVAQILLIALGVMLLFTGIVGFCGLYALLGISTCPVRKHNT